MAAEISSSCDVKNGKKRRYSDSETGQGEIGNSQVTPFRNFKTIQVLTDSSQRKMMCVHGKFEGRDKQDAVVILEKTPFSEDTTKAILTGKTTGEHTLQNDIYATYHLHPTPTLNGKLFP